MDVQQLAIKALSHLELTGENDPRGRRPNIYVTTDGTPEWVFGLIYEAHGGMLPDDHLFQLVADALEHIADGGDDDGHEYADGAVDIYTSDRLAWLASNLNRLSYVDEARAEGITDGTNITEAIGAGQYMEALEVYGSVYRSLETLASDTDESESA